MNFRVQWFYFLLDFTLYDTSNTGYNIKFRIGPPSLFKLLLLFLWISTLPKILYFVT